MKGKCTVLHVCDCRQAIRPFMLEPGKYCADIEYVFQMFSDNNQRAKFIAECLKLGSSYIYEFLIKWGILNLSFPNEEANYNLWYYLCKIDEKVAYLLNNEVSTRCRA